MLTNGAGAQRADSEVEPPASQNRVLYQAEGILGMDLIASGKKAGRIVDVLADRSGHVQAVVVDCGGFLGVGGRKIAVAWSDLHFSPDSPNAVFTNLAQENLAQAPEVKSGKPVVVVTARNRTGPRPEDGVSRN